MGKWEGCLISFEIFIKFSGGSITNFYLPILEQWGRICYLANFKTTSKIRYFANLNLAHKALTKGLTGISSLVYNIFWKEVRKRKRERKRQKREEWHGHNLWSSDKVWSLQFQCPVVEVGVKVSKVLIHWGGGSPWNTKFCGLIQVWVNAQVHPWGTFTLSDVTLWITWHLGGSDGSWPLLSHGPAPPGSAGEQVWPFRRKTSSPLCELPELSQLCKGGHCPGPKPCPTWQHLLLISLFPSLAPSSALPSGAGRFLCPWPAKVPPQLLPMASGLSHFSPSQLCSPKAKRDRWYLKTTSSHWKWLDLTSKTSQSRLKISPVPKLLPAVDIPTHELHPVVAI